MMTCLFLAVQVTWANATCPRSFRLELNPPNHQQMIRHGFPRAQSDRFYSTIMSEVFITTTKAHFDGSYSTIMFGQSITALQSLADSTR